MPRARTVVIIFIVLLPPILESDLSQIWDTALVLVLLLATILPFFGAAYNIYLLQRIHSEKRKIAGVMTEIPLELRASTRWSNEEFNHILMTIQDLQTKMQDSQETLTREALTQRL